MKTRIRLWARINERGVPSRVVTGKVFPYRYRYRHRPKTVRPAGINFYPLFIQYISKHPIYSCCFFHNYSNIGSIIMFFIIKSHLFNLFWIAFSVSSIQKTKFSINKKNVKPSQVLSINHVCNSFALPKAQKKTYHNDFFCLNKSQR